MATEDEPPLRARIRATAEPAPPHRAKSFRATTAVFIGGLAVSALVGVGASWEHRRIEAAENANESLRNELAVVTEKIENIREHEVDLMAIDTMHDRQIALMKLADEDRKSACHGPMCSIPGMSTTTLPISSPPAAQPQPPQQGIAMTGMTMTGPTMWFAAPYPSYVVTAPPPR